MTSLRPRHRRSKFNALSIQDGNTVREKAMMLARGGGGRPDMKAATIEGKAAALEPLRNQAAAQRGQDHKDVRKPASRGLLRGFSHRRNGEAVSESGPQRELSERIGRARMGKRRRSPFLR